MTRLVMVVALLGWLPGAAAAEVAPLAEWRQMRSANFWLAGNVSEGELRQVAGRLEQFRAAVGVILPKATVTTATPTTVVVFRNHKSFAPFKPAYGGKPADHIAGFFLPGMGANFIALTTEVRQRATDDERFGIIYHELVHLMVSNTLRGVPVWFNEGLAEYYRTLRIRGNGRKVVIGGIHSTHVLLLREKQIPIGELVAVDRSSPLYNEGSKAGVLYAQSWALVHYLLLGQNAAHAARMPALIDALTSGKSLAEACQSTLGISEAELQRELRNYVRRDAFPAIEVTLHEPLAAAERLAATRLPDADAHATVGTLLMNMNRLEEGRAHLERALMLDPANASAHSALGMTYARQDRFDKARPHLQAAADAPGSTALGHYMLAVALIRMREAGEGGDVASGRQIEAALRRAIALDGGLADAYAALARELSRRADSGDELFAVQMKAIELSPGREDYQLNFASYLAARQRFGDAEFVLDRLIASASDERLRAHAAALRKRLADPGDRHTFQQVVEWAATGAPAVILDLRPVQDGEKQLDGVLVAIECDTQIRIRLDHGGSTSRLRIKSFEAVEFISYRTDLAGSVSCGDRPAGDRVLVTYRPGASGPEPGEVVAIEFLPPNHPAR